LREHETGFNDLKRAVSTAIGKEYGSFCTWNDRGATAMESLGLLIFINELSARAANVHAALEQAYPRSFNGGAVA
jgi:hypothetical protein